MEGAGVQFTNSQQEEYDANHRYCTEFVCRLKPSKASQRAAKLAKSFEVYGNSTSNMLDWLTNHHVGPYLHFINLSITGLVPLKVPGKEVDSQLFKVGALVRGQMKGRKKEE